MADTLSDLSQEAKAYWAKDQWGAYRNVRYETAEHERRRGMGERAAYLYLEVMIFDLQGVTGATNGQKFNRAYQRETPSVAREIARFCRREEIDLDELKSMYRRVARKFWVDAFPRSRAEVWAHLRERVEDHRTTLRLREKVSAIGPDRLLSSEKAEAFARRANDYEVLQRVGTLLEGEPPAGIPWPKRKRAHEYLSSVDIWSIGERWRGKAFRWAGEVVLANGETDAAMTYLEKARAVVGRDERAEVERLLGTLRREFNGQER